MTAVPLFTPTRNAATRGWPSPAVRWRRAVRARREPRATAWSGWSSERVEHGHHRVAGEPLDHAARAGDRGDRHRPVRVEHRDHLAGRPVLGEGREPHQVGEQDADFEVTAAELAERRLGLDRVHQTGPDIAPQQLVDSGSSRAEPSSTVNSSLLKPSRRSSSRTGVRGRSSRKASTTLAMPIGVPAIDPPAASAPDTGRRAPRSANGRGGTRAARQP